MSKSNAFETANLLLWLNNTNIANVGDETGLRGSTTVGSLYFALHTADPGEAGDQTTSEAAYTGYARVAKTRTVTDFTVAGNAGSLATNANFPNGSGGGGTATHWSLGVAASGASMILFKGALTPTIAMGAGVAPQILAGTMVTED